jgi:DNA-directed RNA polymerase specialized sigma24 family protein
MPTSPSATNSLVIRARAGDQEAARVLYDQYSGSLLRLIRRRMHPRLFLLFDPEDVLQEAWIGFYTAKQLPCVASNERLGAYLVGIADHKLGDLHRKFLDNPKRDLRRRELAGLAVLGWD